MKTPKTETEKLEFLKNKASTVYLCQVLTFFLAGVPLLIGVLIDFMSKEEAQGTWLESHFDWQITTVWVTLAGLALAGLTFEIGVGLFILLPTTIWLVYRIVVGWTALHAGRPVKEED